MPRNEFVALWRERLALVPDLTDSQRRRLYFAIGGKLRRDEELIRLNRATPAVRAWLDTLRREIHTTFWWDGAERALVAAAVDASILHRVIAEKEQQS